METNQEPKYIAVMSLSAFHGIGIIEIDHGIETRVKFQWLSDGANCQPAKWAKLRDSRDRFYFISYGRRYYIDEFMRTNF